MPISWCCQPLWVEFAAPAVPGAHGRGGAWQAFAPQDPHVHPCSLLGVRAEHNNFLHPYQERGAGRAAPCPSPLPPPFSSQRTGYSRGYPKVGLGSLWLHLGSVEQRLELSGLYRTKVAKRTMVRSWRKKHSPERCSLAAARSAMLQSSLEHRKPPANHACEAKSCPEKPRKMKARSNLGLLAERVSPGVGKLQQSLSFALLFFGGVVCPAARRKRKRKELTSKVWPLWGSGSGALLVQPNCDLTLSK